MDAITVRFAAMGDAPAVCTIYNQGIDDRVATLETELRDADERRRWLSSRGTRYPVIVAEARGQIIGWSSLNVFNPRRAYDHVADISVYVERSWRGKGAGRLLLARSIELGQGLGFHKLVLACFPTNKAGVALYERMGFAAVGTYHEQGLLDGRWVDVLINGALAGIAPEPHMLGRIDTQARGSVMSGAMLAVALGADHAGWELKEALKAWLMDTGYQVLDFGAHGPDSVDYPDYAAQVAEAVSVGKVDRGLLVGGTGIGMTIAANKVPGIRAALCSDVFTARMSREHNDANVLALAGRLTGRETGFEILRAWLETSFAGGRHARRVDKIAEMERVVARARAGA